MKRREFLRASGAAAALVAVGCASRDGESMEPTTTNQLSSIGLQLYTIRGMMRESVEDTLAAVASAGYNEVEFAGYFEHEPEAVRAMLDANGLTSPSTHVSLDALEADADAQFAVANTLGQKYIVVPYYAQEHRTVEGYRALCSKLNALGTRAQDAGLTIAYHNHDFEFETVDGVVPYDMLLSETDPDLVKMQLDLYWIWYAAKSAEQYLKADPNRYVSCHVKDGYADGTQSVVGGGDVDLAAAFRAGSFEHFFVESDNPEDETQFINASAAYLKELAY